MSEKIYKAYSSELTDIADAIRAKTGGTEELEFPDEFVSEISRISGGGGTIPTKTSELENDSGFISSEQTQHIYGQASEPLAAEEGDIWIDTDDDSSIITNVSVFTQTTAPTDANQGDLWIDTSSDVGDGVYLPLGAGADNPLTNDLWLINTEENVDPALAIKIDEIHKGTVYYSANDFMSIVARDSTGTISTGARFYGDSTNGVRIFSDGHNITLRPNGPNSSSGEVYIDSTGWMNGKGFHADAISSDQVNRIGDVFFYRKTNVSGGAMTAGTLKTIDTITQSAYRPNADVDTGFAIGYNNNSVLPLRYGYVRIKSDGSVQVSPNESVANSCYWTIIAMWRNPNFNG